MLQSSNIERAKKACQVVGVKSFQLDLDPNPYRITDILHVFIQFHDIRFIYRVPFGWFSSWLTNRVSNWSSVSELYIVMTRNSRCTMYSHGVCSQKMRQELVTLINVINACTHTRIHQCWWQKLVGCHPQVIRKFAGQSHGHKRRSLDLDGGLFEQLGFI